MLKVVELTVESPRAVNVATEHPGAPMGYVMIDRGNTNGGVHHYQSGVAGDQPE